MSILVYTEINKGRVKKASLECVNYAAKIAQQTGGTVTAIVNNATSEQLAEIGKAGAAKILSVKNDALAGDNMLLCAAIEQAAKSENSKIIVFSFDFVGKAVAPRLAARLK